MEDAVLIELLDKLGNRLDVIEDENQSLKNQISNLHNKDEIDIDGIQGVFNKIQEDKSILFENGEIYWNKIKALDASINKQQINQRLFEVKVQERQDKMIQAMEKCIDFHNWHVDNFNEWRDAIQVALEQVHEFHKTNMSKIHDMFLNIDAPECEKPDVEGLLVDLKPLPTPPEIKKSSKWDYLGAIFH